MATDAERREALDGAVRRALEKGARLESRTNYSAVLVVANKPNHLLHLVLSIVTFGIWLLTWLLILRRGDEVRVQVSVDDDAVIHTRPLGRPKTSAPGAQD
jgi:Na+-transporting NADH:ubiquinone oxidoreductase subunit NqrC